MLGTSELPANQKFSKEAIARAAKEFRDLAIARGEWLSGRDISKVIKKAPWNCEKTVIEKFGFINYFKRSHTYYFNRKDLVELGKELKKKNIDLNEYMDLLADQAKFESLVKGIELKKGSKYKRYKIPEELRDIHSRPFSPEIEEKAKKEIDDLLSPSTQAFLQPNPSKG